MDLIEEHFATPVFLSSTLVCVFLIAAFTAVAALSLSLVPPLTQYSCTCQTLRQKSLVFEGLCGPTPMRVYVGLSRSTFCLQCQSPKFRQNQHNLSVQEVYGQMQKHNALGKIKTRPEWYRKVQCQ